MGGVSRGTPSLDIEKNMPYHSSKKKKKKAGKKKK
jgi:hypothetical protein